MVFLFSSNRKTLKIQTGATICGYAVDIGGRMVKASVCKKETARVAFETGIRENRGATAILENVAGNEFKVLYALACKQT